MNELEQRVQALEQELQILKNQIQAILLDIQEQVLSNTYPGLRTSDSPQDNPPPQRPRPEPEDQVRPTPAVRKVSFNDFSDLEDDEDDEVPMVAPPPRSKKRKNHSDIINEMNHEDDHWQVMADLKEWAKKKIDVIGVQETADLIRTNTIKGRFTPEERDALIDFVALHVTSYPDAPTQPSRPAPFEVTARPHQPARAQAATAPSAQPPARSVQNSAPQAKPAKSKPQRKATVAKTKPQYVLEKPTQDKESLVLRLIAGVQNAGAGIRWGKNDG